MEDKLLHKDLSYAVRGLLFKVHNDLGRFKNEQQYGDYLEVLLKEDNLKYVREYILPPSFVGERKSRNKIDFLIENTIVVELKCATFLNKDHYFQCQRYLSCLNLDLALLVNFRSKYLTIRRVLNPNRLVKHP